jgi:Ternary complex associated domain 7
MELINVAEQTYLMIPADWTVALARQFLDQAEYTHVIVVSEESRYHYLFSKQETLDYLANKEASMPVWEAFNLREAGATQTFDAHTDAFSDALEDVVRAVVLDKKGVAGFRDTSAPRFETIKREMSFPASERFEAYPSLDAPAQVAPEVPFDFFVGFRSDPDPALEGVNRFVIDNPPPGGFGA